MCGRFVQAHDPSFYAEAFGGAVLQTASRPPSYNVAPTDPVYAIAEHDGERLLGSFRWGLIPWWAKDRRIAVRNINARAETLSERSSFRDSFAHRRCLIPADGFFEWQHRSRGKLPHYIYRADGRPLALAGLWSSWKDPETGDRMRTCTIITGRPNELVAGLHDRMPVILAKGAWDEWLDPENQDPTGLQSLLRVLPSSELVEHPVATLVNRVANNYPECIAPLRTGVVEPSDG